VTEDYFFEKSLVTNSRYSTDSIHGWLITRSENTIVQNYGDNFYRLDINFASGRNDYYRFYMENGYLIMHNKNHNGLFIYRFEKE
jgi:hypothetical protein